MTPRGRYVAAVAVAAVVAGCNRDPNTTAWNFERMLRQPRADAYEATRLFADGAAMRPPPDGTIARDRVIGPPALVDGRDAGQWSDHVPLPVDRALLAEGRERFDVYCAACHGVLGDGDSPVADNMRLRRPPSLHSARVRALPPGRVYSVITEGYGIMPAHADVLSVRQRWAVVAYVGALQLSQHATATTLPPAAAADVAARADAATPGGEHDAPIAEAP